MLLVTKLKRAIVNYRNSEWSPEMPKLKEQKLENRLNEMIQDFKKDLHGIRNWQNAYITMARKNI